MENITDWWQLLYGAATPISYILREQIPERWMRIHSLPESKRYAETPGEYEILLARHNEVATEVLGAQSPCILFAGQYAVNREAEIHLSGHTDLGTMNFKLFQTIEEHDPVCDPPLDIDFLKIWWAPVTWSSGQFDKIIKAIADDEVSHLLFISLVTGEAYAPYNGGADLFLNSTTRRDELKQRYAPWLSSHPKGL